jgi:hypothetical protein
MMSVPEVEFRYHTKYLDIAPLSDVPICAGTLVMSDDHVDHVLGVLEMDFEGRIPIYLSREGELDLRALCSTDKPVGGCYTGVIFSKMRAVYHEIVHALTVPEARSWWTEGVAHAFVFRKYYSTPDFTTGWNPLRGESGHFSRWIIENHGGDTFMELYRRTPYGADQPTVERAVREVLGQEFQDVLSEYARTAPYVYPDHLACYVPHDAVETPWVDAYWEQDIVLDCDQTNTFSSGDSEEQRMEARIPVTIPTAGYFNFIADDPGAEVAVQPCLIEPSMEPIPGAEDWPIRFPSGRYFQAGPHVLIVSVPPGAPTTLRLAGFPEIAEQRVP